MGPPAASMAPPPVVSAAPAMAQPALQAAAPAPAKPEPLVGELAGLQLDPTSFVKKAAAEAAAEANVGDKLKQAVLTGSNDEVARLFNQCAAKTNYAAAPSAGGAAPGAFQAAFGTGACGGYSQMNPQQLAQMNPQQLAQMKSDELVQMQAISSRRSK